MNYLHAPLTQLPTDLLCAADYERLAPDFIAPDRFAYLQGGSGAEQTLRANLSAFAQVSVQQRLLRDCRAGHTQLSLFGQRFAHPFFLAPVAYQQLVHAEGERACAQGAAAADCALILSTLSSLPLEQVQAPARWFQLYWQPDRAHTLDLIRRAEAAGYQAIVLTLDTPVQPQSARAQRAGFALPAGIRAANLVDYPAPARVALAAGSSVIFQGMMADAPDWAAIDWLRQQTRLPLLVKGVSHPDDARALKNAGIDGLVVSNHGGRALDGARASLQDLQAVRAAVGADFPLLFDGGIRSGLDAFKALALGADVVLVGRLQVYALAVAGPLGVAHLIRLLRQELELTMALAACPTLAHITEEALSCYW